MSRTVKLTEGTLVCNTICIQIENPNCNNVQNPKIVAMLKIQTVVTLKIINMLKDYY